jgi:DNA end-binding protein Ku
MAKQLVSAMTGDFEADRYRDEYREALLKVIEAKVDGQPVAMPEPVMEARGLTDLMAVLEASVAAARDARKAAPVAEAQSTSTSKSKSKAKAASVAESVAESEPPEIVSATPQRRRKSA